MNNNEELKAQMRSQKNGERRENWAFKPAKDNGFGLTATQPGIPTWVPKREGEPSPVPERIPKPEPKPQRPEHVPQEPSQPEKEPEKVPEKVE